MAIIVWRSLTGKPSEGLDKQHHTFLEKVEAAGLAERITSGEELPLQIGGELPRRQR